MAEGSWDETSEPVAFIRHTGIWDMQDLYESVAEFFRRRKYKFHEKVYKHKRPSPFGVERQYIWEAERKENDYVQFHYDVYIHTYDAHDVEAVGIDGSKKRFTKGRIWVQIKADIATDWESRWKDNTFYSRLRDFYNKYIIRRNFTQGWNPKVRYEMYELHAMVKERLKMESDEYEHMIKGAAHRRF
ncbi:MAG: hypothetical protein KKC54_02145 [Nanoarchaeota archaeon]|nr:hypothetical protein [Nanoarchaeota archaeon]MBU1945747.1 hypothetical protein [Nanoarchaeota archaeon]